MAKNKELLPRRPYSAAEVAEIFGCARETVFRIVARGDLHGRRFGRKLFVTGAELLRYLDHRDKSSRPNRPKQAKNAKSAKVEEKSEA